MATSEERLNGLMDECQRTVLDAILGPFGLSGVIFSDKTGGDVDTIHNAREGVYASDEQRKAYENRGEYDSASYHQHENYIATNRKGSKTVKSGGHLDDAYSDHDIGPTNDNSARQNLDHVVSAHEVHDDAGRVLAGLKGEDLANADGNLRFTNEHINKTKKDKSMAEYVEYRRRVRAEQEAQIAALEAKKAAGTLTESEAGVLESTKAAKEKYDKDGFDEEKALAEDKRAREEYNRKVNLAYYTSADFLKSTGIASAKAGMKMGAQQIMGLFLREFATGAITEVRIIIATHKNNSEPIFNRIKKALKRLGERMLACAHWKKLLSTFFEGGLAGIISTLTTTLINAFATTAKKFVKAIREGWNKLVEAFKILVWPPDGMSALDVTRNFCKAVSAAVVVGLGVVLEPALHSALDGVLPFGPTVVSVLMAILTGVTVALVAYILDSLFDKFALNAKTTNDIFASGIAARQLEAEMLNLTDQYIRSVEEFEQSIRGNAEIYHQYRWMSDCYGDMVDSFDQMIERYGKGIVARRQLNCALAEIGDDERLAALAAKYGA